MDVEFVVGNLTDFEVEAIVNPANSEGEMGGGVAGALKKAGGKKIEEEAMTQAPIAIGKAVMTSAGKLKSAFIIHAPTMKVPAQRTSAENITQALHAALTTARESGIRSLAIPGMGTGTGKVPVEEAAEAMIAVIRNHPLARSTLEKLVLVDRNEAMVRAWERCWVQPEEE
ncbi:MAG: macro domain-containing protein [bacterium]